MTAAITARAFARVLVIGLLGIAIPAIGHAADLTVNAPTLPPVGSPFPAAIGPYANFVALQTVSAGPHVVDVQNMSGGLVLVIVDDGTAPVGQSPVNTILQPVNGGPPGGYGGLFSTSSTGRLQVYGPAGAFVRITVR